MLLLSRAEWAQMPQGISVLVPEVKQLVHWQASGDHQLAAIEILVSMVYVAPDLI